MFSITQVDAALDRQQVQLMYGEAFSPLIMQSYTQTVRQISNAVAILKW